MCAELLLRKHHTSELECFYLCVLGGRNEITEKKMYNCPSSVSQLYLVGSHSVTAGFISTQALERKRLHSSAVCFIVSLQIFFAALHTFKRSVRPPEANC